MSLLSKTLKTIEIASEMKKLWLRTYTTAPIWDLRVVGTGVQVECKLGHKSPTVNVGWKSWFRAALDLSESTQLAQFIPKPSRYLDLDDNSCLTFLDRTASFLIQKKQMDWVEPGSSPEPTMSSGWEKEQIRRPNGSPAKALWA